MKDHHDDCGEDLSSNGGEDLSSNGGEEMFVDVNDAVERIWLYASRRPCLDSDTFLNQWVEDGQWATCMDLDQLVEDSQWATCLLMCGETALEVYHDF